ncbi:hypothetical protein GCM10010218_44420 [Streptomyces mashuensis]|uniref:Uncharacterized protein n=1 Tax=Streptomyces mashuensis TaxID=33904 RepID=A0A919B7G6_9ACTN|nr:hypothetical protein [Streptomyces mashuensis]GHF58099.1 hypothetical protein GCM10010218_44420 [Streptomyces mashuensis]
MPRRRPEEVRAALPRRRRPHDHLAPSLVIDGLSARTLAEISRLERTRTYLFRGEVSQAVRLWKDHVGLPVRVLAHHYEQGCLYWDCCGDPLEARVLLDDVMQALSRKSARELRAELRRFDELWHRRSPLAPFVGDVSFRGLRAVLYAELPW